MSYINEALKKAQEEKNSRYGKPDFVVLEPAEKGRRGRSARRAVFAVIFVVFLGAALFAFAPRLMDMGGFGLPPPAPKGDGFAASAPKRDAPKAEMPKTGTTPHAVVSVKGPAGSPEPSGEAEAKRLYAEAAQAARSGDVSRAKLLYGKTLTLFPNHVEALNNLGVMYLAEKKPDRALALFRRAILQKRDYVDPYYNIACLYAQKHDIDQSLWYLKMAISIDKDVINWAKKDADLKMVAASPKFKEIDGGAKN